MGRLIALAAALIGAALIAFWDMRPPGPVPASAPATDFSSSRAMEIVQAMAGPGAHAIGSEANHRVRDGLIARMTALGLSPQVRPGKGFESRSFGGRAFVSGGDVENIVGVLPGRDRQGPALALMAHYDSVPGSPGAGDDAAGVATALETVRAIKARGVPARDVMVLITDGEEAGLLGANAFFARDPLAARVGFVVNMESRGNAGRAQMFQTGIGNGASVALVQRTAQRPQASSLTGFIYEHMPNDTDFTVSRKKGIGGLNYAFIGHQFDYHSPTSTPPTLDQGTLQDMGRQVLASASAAAFAPALPAKTSDLVYSPLLGVMVAYPPWVGWALLALAAALIAWGFARARRLEAIPWTDLARGLGAGVFSALAAAAVLHWARLATGAAVGYLEQRFLLAQAPRWEAALIVTGLGVLLVCVAELARGRRLVALLPLAAALASCLISGGVDRVALIEGIAAALVGAAAYGRPVSRAGAWTGVLVLGLILGVVVQALAPAAGFVVAWPLLAAALGGAITAMAADRRDWGLVALAIIAALAGGWIGGLAHASYLSLDLPELLVMPVILGLLVLWPLAQCSEGAPPERLAGPILLVIGVALTAAVRWNDPWDARHPQVAYVAYEADQDSGKAWRVDTSGDHTAWSRQVLTADGGRIGPHDGWWFRGAGVRAAPARPVALPQPAITLDRQADGRLHLHAQPPPGARVLVLQLTPDTPGVIEAVDGAPADLVLPPGKPTRVTWSNAPNGFDLTIRPAGPGKLEARYAAVFETWPKDAAPLPKRPANLMPFDLSDSTFAVGTRRFSW